MFLVLVNGALVTKTESGRGCGDDWPLCNGKFIPAYTVESMIEYSHRFVSGIVGLLVLFAALALYRYAKSNRDAREARFFAYGALFFTVLQAVLGAFAVKWEQSSLVMALHFGISMLAFACTLMVPVLLRRTENGNTADKASGLLLRVSRPYRNFVWLVTFYSYVVVYLGAYVRHTESSGGCTGWPLCNGEVIPELSGAAGAVFIHRFAALLLLIAAAALLIVTLKRYGSNRELVQLAVAGMILLIFQILSGALVVAALGMEDVFLFASMLHTVIIAGLFGVFFYMSFRVWQRARK
jgi:cytochrome c oxidase assembly protein subunit 15